PASAAVCGGSPALHRQSKRRRTVWPKDAPALASTRFIRCSSCSRLASGSRPSRSTSWRPSPAIRCGGPWPSGTSSAASPARSWPRCQDFSTTQGEKAGWDASPPGTWCSIWPPSCCSRSMPSSGSASTRIRSGRWCCPPSGSWVYSCPAGSAASWSMSSASASSSRRARARTGLAAWPSSGAQDDFQAVVLLVEEHVEPRRRVAQRQPVGDDEARIDLAPLDSFEQRLHVSLDVTLAGPDRERPVDNGAHRKLVDETAVHADHRHGPAVATGMDGLPQSERPVALESERLLRAVVGIEWPGHMRFHPHRVDARVGASPASSLAQGLVDVDLLVVERLRSTRLPGQAQTIRE